jgi:hypothetical protein
MRFDRRARRSLIAPPLLALLLALLSACVTQTRPSGCDDAEVTVEVFVTADSMRPENVAVCREQSVTLVINSSTDGYLHVHGFDEYLPITEVSAGSEERVEFTAGRSGQFPIELHLGNDPSGLGVGILTVHEP